MKQQTFSFPEKPSEEKVKRTKCSTSFSSGKVFNLRRKLFLSETHVCSAEGEFRLCGTTRAAREKVLAKPYQVSVVLRRLVFDEVTRS